MLFLISTFYSGFFAVIQLFFLVSGQSLRYVVLRSPLEVSHSFLVVGTALRCWTFSVFHCAFPSDAFLAFLGAPCLTVTFVASCVGLCKEKLCWCLCRQGLRDLFVVCHAPRVLTCPVFSYVLCWKILCSGESARVLSELLEPLNASSPEALSTLKFSVLLRAMRLSACLQVHFGGSSMVDWGAYYRVINMFLWWFWKQFYLQM